MGSLYSTTSGCIQYSLLVEYSKNFTLRSALPFVWKLPFDVCQDFGTCLVRYRERVCLFLLVGRKGLDQTLSPVGLLFCYWGNLSEVVCSLWKFDFQLRWLLVPWHLDISCAFVNIVTFLVFGVWYLCSFWHHCCWIIRVKLFTFVYLGTRFF